MNRSDLFQKMVTYLSLLTALVLLSTISFGQALPPLSPLPDDRDLEDQAEVDSLEDLLSGFTDDYVDLISELEVVMEEFESLFKDYGRISLKETEKSLYQLQKLLFTEYSESARQEMMIQLEVTLKNLKSVEIERDDKEQYSVRKYLRRLQAMEDDLEDIEEQLEEEFEELDELELFDDERLSNAVNRALKKYYKEFRRNLDDNVVDVPRVPGTPRPPKSFPVKLRQGGIATGDVVTDPIAPPYGVYVDPGEYDDYLTRSASITVDDGDVVIALENAMGGISVSTWNRNEIQVELTIGYSDDSPQSKNRAEEIELSVFNHDGQMVIVKVHYPKNGDKVVNIVSSQLDVTLPRNNQIKIDNSFGPVSVSELDNQVLINSSFAQVEVENISGAVTLNNANGTIYVDHVSGRLTANNSFGAIEAANISGDIRLTNSYAPISTLKTIGQLDIKSSGPVTTRKHIGEAEIHSSNGDMEIYAIKGDLVAFNSFGIIRVEGVVGDADIKNSNGRMEVYKVEGALKVSNRFAPIHIEAIGQETWVECSNGEVSIENVGAEVFVSNRFGEVRINTTGGSVKVDNSGSPVTISEVRGDVEVVNQHAPVFLEDIDGDIDIENQNASIDLIGIGGESVVSTTYGLISCDRLGGPFKIHNNNGSVEMISIDNISDDCRVTTTYGEIIISLPTAGKFNLKANTSWGGIKSDFPMKISTEGSVSTGEYLSGKNSPTITLSGNNASIIVLKE